MKGGKKTRRTPVKKSVRAGIYFPVSRIARMFRKGLYCKRLSEGAAIAMASILEFIIYEIMEQSLMFMKEKKKARLTPEFIRMAILEDEEFK